ncbi:MAG: hypothetical protein ABJM06_03370 [Gilvibacter sp.]|uniref:hypothetical protein n=1 Tax=Nonlabens ulvanivorans TaxID=906888 RepID=UPI0032979314
MLLRSLLVCVIVATAYACVKDTDFDQASDIEATPEIELDLVYFTLTPPQFTLDTDSGRPISVRDTTDIRFLDDSFVQDALKRVEYYFRFSNSIPSEFNANVRFLNGDNDVRYQFDIDVAQGALDTPVITEHIEILATRAQIRRITESSKVVVRVTIPEAPQTVEGFLNLQSKGTYFLEY